MKKLIAIVIFIIIPKLLFSQAVASFNLPYDTLCKGTSMTIQNTSTGVVSNDNYWNFCSGNLYDTPLPTNLGNLDPTAQAPVRISINRDGNNYYAFYTSNQGNKGITKLKFSGSFSNTPVVTNIGTLGGMIYIPQGIQIRYDSVANKWFGLVCNNFGNAHAEFEGHLARLDFGNSLDNIPSVTIVDSTKGQSLFPHGLNVMQDQNGDWWAFASNMRNFLTGFGYQDHFISRYYFGNSLANAPVLSKITETDLGKPLATPQGTFLSSPTSFNVVQGLNGDWYGIALNSGNSTLTKVYFGTSLGATKTTGLTGQNIGKVTGMNSPSDFQLIADCNRYYAIIINNNNGLSMASFDQLEGIPGSPPKGWSLGNIAMGAGISETYRKGDTLFCFVIRPLPGPPPVGNYGGDVYRLIFKGCDTPPSTTAQHPIVTYPDTGRFNIRLSINQTSSPINQKSTCKTVVVLEPPTLKPPVDTSYCYSGTGLTLTTNSGFQQYKWATSPSDTTYGLTRLVPADTGTYLVTLDATFYNCKEKDTNRIVVLKNPLMQTTQPSYLRLLVHASSGNPPYQYQVNNYGFRSDSLFTDLMPNTYQVTVRDAEGCQVVQEVTITQLDIMIPNYFTPNGEGDPAHEKWYMQGIVNFPKADIKIYDRYGVLLASFKGSDFESAHGWDGTYQNRPMPSDDYWFYVDLNDGRKPYTGHVTLKR